MEKIKGIKGFNHDMTCRGFQYEVGKSYEIDGDVSACKRGFHACPSEDPLAVWNYYPPITDSGVTAYADVTQYGEVDRHYDKIASARITIDAAVSLPEFVRRAVSAIVNKSTTGDEAHAATTGYRAHAAATGNRAHAATTGDEAHAATTGYMAHAATTGEWAHAATTGLGAHAATTGFGARAEVASPSASAMAAGRMSRVRGVDGSALHCNEIDIDGTIVSAACGIVGRDGIKSGTWYHCKGGALVEVEE